MKSEILIPKSELKFTFSRSSGAGGQKVNKTETKVTIHWGFKKSKFLDDQQKSLIQETLKNRINESGEVVVYSQAARTQALNRQGAIRILNDLVTSALAVHPERKPTKLPRQEKRKRLEKKRRQSQKKELRRGIDY